MIYFLINSLYNYAEEMEKQFGLEMTANGYWFFIIAQIVSTLAIFIVFYTFRSIGLYKMAEKKGMEKPWLAVLPFSALYITSALAPKSKYIKTYKNLSALSHDILTRSIDKKSKLTKRSKHQR